MTAGSARRRLRTTLLRLMPGAGRARPLDHALPPDLPRRPQILVVRPDHVGDVLFTGPAVRQARSAWPDAVITMLVGPWAAPIAARLPGVDEVRTLTFPWYDRRERGSPWQPYVLLRREAENLRTPSGQPYDAAVVLRDDDYWGAWLTARARVPVRVGHADPGVQRFVSHVLPERMRPAHTAGANIALVGALAGQSLGAPSPDSFPLELRLLPDDEELASSLLSPHLGPGSGLGSGRGPIAVHPGSGAAVKRWRAAAWAHSLAQLTAPDEAIVITGGESERKLAAEITEQLGALSGARLDSPARRTVIDLTGRTGLGALAAVYARCSLVMGPDSGPLHLAAAVGTPTVHLFGPADAARFGPWGPGARHKVVDAGLPCAPCARLDWPDVSNHPCVRVIEAGAVVAAARSCSATSAAERSCEA